MIQWKQRLYAFLLRHVLGPFLDASSAKRLHDTIDVSFHEGKFVLKDVILDADYLTEMASTKTPGLRICSARVGRLEIHLKLRENTTGRSKSTTGTRATADTCQSSLAWRALKLGTTTMNASLPAVSLIAEVKVEGISVELEPIDFDQRPKRRRRKQHPETSSSSTTTSATTAHHHRGGSTTTTSSHASGGVSVSNVSSLSDCPNAVAATAAAAAAEEEDVPSSKSVIGSYIDAALASLQLNLSFTNLQFKLVRRVVQALLPNKNASSSNSPSSSTNKEIWVNIRLSSFVYRDLDLPVTNETATVGGVGGGSSREGGSGGYKTVGNKSIDISEILVQTGERVLDEHGISSESTVALVQGTGKMLYRVVSYDRGLGGIVTSDDINKPDPSTPPTHLQQDVEIKLNHQFNISVDHNSLHQLQQVGYGFADLTDTREEDGDGIGNGDDGTSGHVLQTNPLMNNPGFMEDTDVDREDLKVLTGIMRQYREAYHLAENNQLRGGILVPSNAYLDGGHLTMEEVDEDGMTFDVFFDANDQSFYNAASVLANSIRPSPKGADRSPANQKSLDFVHTKVLLHLLSACVKVVFRDPNHHYPNHFVKAEEYILATVNDFSVSVSSTQRSSDIELNVQHFEVEDAQRTKQKIGNVEYTSSVGGSPVFAGAVEIGRVLGFRSDSSLDDHTDDNELIVSQAPCINVHWNNTRNRTGGRATACDITLLPVEIFHRYQTVANLSIFAAVLRKRASEMKEISVPPRPFRVPSSLSTDEQEMKRFNLTTTCPSISLFVPLLSHVQTSPLFERSSDLLKDVVILESALGVSFENLSAEWRTGIGKEDNVDECEDDDNDDTQRVVEGGIFCHNILVFAVGPEADRADFHSRMLRKDFLAVSGRVEVNPCIPVSISFVKMECAGSNLARDSFPIVPAISSFKARQEDDDEDLKTDSLLFSKLGEVNTDSRKELRGTDPQISMLSYAEKSTSVVTIDIPQILSDVTKTELSTLCSMLVAARPEEAQPAVQTQQFSGASPSTESRETISIAINCDEVSLLVREDPTSRFSGNDPFACMAAMDRIRFHLLLYGSVVKQCRVLCHDPCLYAAYGRLSASRTLRPQKGGNERVESLRSTVRQIGNMSVTPVVFRSHIFTPISQETPSILLDFINLSAEAANDLNEMKQRRVHVTLYHLTCRYAVDSDWVERLLTILPSVPKSEPGEGAECTTKGSHMMQKQPSRTTMTRVFMSTADINLDYTVPAYFETISRSIVRMSDFRFSCNLMTPAGLVQAFSVSIGDITYDICGSKASYHDENASLCRSMWIVGKERSQQSRTTKSVFGTMPEAVLRELGFVNVLSLDMVDAVVVQRKPGGSSKEPPLATSLTFGTLSIHACKDSFGCFASTVGELQAKLTALTDYDLEKMKNDHQYEAPTEARMESSPTTTTHAFSDDIIPSIPAPAGAMGKNEDSYLLDGYEWTSISSNSSKDVIIPPGDEQVAGWYSSSDEGDLGGNFPGQIVHQHFPLPGIADPLAEGDMGVHKYVGNTAVAQAKSRLLIHKLNLKMRFFDGYDWPEKCTERQREAASKPGRAFVIEPLPQVVSEEEKKELSDEMEIARKVSLARKAKLMGDLLGGKDNDQKTFKETPLPGDRASQLALQKTIRMCSRVPNTFFQLSLNGVALRMDSYMVGSHRLQSIMELSVSKLFVAETVSLSTPVKMLGEWMSDREHPRDTRFGTLMMKMATWSPEERVSSLDEINSDVCEVTMQLLPMRCLLDQRAIAFIRAFFNNGAEETYDGDKMEMQASWSDGHHVIPPPRFRQFKVKPWKVKVDYSPSKIDVAALREGSIVELVNISPIQRMVITLSEVMVVDSLGGGSVFSEIVSSWVKEICATQLHKFLANARPFEPFTDVGQGLTDLVVLPYEAFKQGDSVQRAMTKGMKSLAEIVAFQALTTTAGLTKYAADLMADALGGKRQNTAANPLPARPPTVPKGIGDVRQHAVESLARGLRAANYKVVVVPYREFSRNGVTGALTSVIKGIPVLLVAPLTGVTEAASYTLLGARNAIRPDIRKEEEASMSLF